MKNYKHLYIVILLMVLALAGCDENDVLPDYKVVGDAYATVVDFGVSNDEPAAGETVQITLSYVNYKEDPLTSLTFYEQVDGGDRTQISTLDESSAPIDAQVERSFNYTVPAASDVTIYVELQSAKEYPQVEKVDISVQ